MKKNLILSLLLTTLSISLFCSEATGNTDYKKNRKKAPRSERKAWEKTNNKTIPGQPQPHKQLLDKIKKRTEEAENKKKRLNIQDYDLIENRLSDAEFEKALRLDRSPKQKIDNDKNCQMNQYKNEFEKLKASYYCKRRNRAEAEAIKKRMDELLLEINIMCIEQKQDTNFKHTITQRVETPLDTSKNKNKDEEFSEMIKYSKDIMSILAPTVKDMPEELRKMMSIGVVGQDSDGKPKIVMTSFGSSQKASKEACGPDIDTEPEGEDENDSDEKAKDS